MYKAQKLSMSKEFLYFLRWGFKIKPTNVHETINNIGSNMVEESLLKFMSSRLGGVTFSLCKGNEVSVHTTCTIFQHLNSIQNIIFVVYRTTIIPKVIQPNNSQPHSKATTIGSTIQIKPLT